MSLMTELLKLTVTCVNVSVKVENDEDDHYAYFELYFEYMLEDDHEEVVYNNLTAHINFVKPGHVDIVRTELEKVGDIINGRHYYFHDPIEDSRNMLVSELIFCEAATGEQTLLHKIIHGIYDKLNPHDHTFEIFVVEDNENEIILDYPDGDMLVTARRYRRCFDLI